MNPEAAEAIRIADKYLPSASPARRAALAKEIISAIMQHAGNVARHVLAEAVVKSTAPERNN